MTKETTFIVDPYNEKHIELFKEFEQTHDNVKKISSKLEKISDNLSKDEYIKLKKQNNEIEEILFTKGENNIKDFCHIRGEKDMKTCYLYLPTLKETTKNRTIIKEATEYSLNYLNMETIFVMIEQKDKKTIEALEKLSYENLGTEDGMVTYMTEKEKTKEKRRTI